MLLTTHNKCHARTVNHHTAIFRFTRTLRTLAPIDFVTLTAMITQQFLCTMFSLSAAHVDPLTDEHSRGTHRIVVVVLIEFETVFEGHKIDQVRAVQCARQSINVVRH